MRRYHYESPVTVSKKPGTFLTLPYRRGVKLLLEVMTDVREVVGRPLQRQNIRWVLPMWVMFIAGVPGSEFVFSPSLKALANGDARRLRYDERGASANQRRMGVERCLCA